MQARPATGHGYPEGGDAVTVWSNVNVGEALPGVATPFTWSVAGAFSEGLNFTMIAVRAAVKNGSRNFFSQRFLRH